MKLYEMAMPLSVAKQKLVDLSYSYTEHIMKCVVFGDSTNDMFHWEQEIANSIKEVNDITVKPYNKKLKETVYRDYFFLGQGDELSDIRLFIEIWQRKNGKYYPSFQLNDVLCSTMLDVLIDFSDFFSVVVSQKNNYSKTYFVDKIVEYFDDFM